MRPILTIAIPTYNNQELLLKQLALLEPQLTNETELIIIDNCSKPSVKSVLSERFIARANFQLIESPENIGADRNIFKCLNCAKSDWVWVLSDNDFVVNDAVKTIISEIKNNKKALFINFGNTKNTITKGLHEFFKSADYINSFTISNCIYNVSELAVSFPMYEACLKTHQAQLLFIIKHLESHNEPCVFSSEMITDEFLPAKWPKYAFINDTNNIYNFIRAEDFPVFKRTLGKQVIRMQLFLLIEAYCTDGLSLKHYIATFSGIIKNSSLIQFLSKGGVKLIAFFMFFLFFPGLYVSHYRKESEKADKSTVNNSKWIY